MTKRLILIGVALLITTTAWGQPILDYVNRPEPAYAWEKTDEETMGTVSVTHLKVTSQTWQDITWTHRVYLMVPDEMTHPETALLLITGGAPDRDELTMLSTAATMLSSPVVILGDIPNQPLFDDLTEDALIAFTFSNYLETHDANWPLLFPMTKAAVKTMDAVEQYTADEWERPITSFVATGASKRGWTTWFTGAVVPGRLKGIAPMVYDNLNLPAQMRQHLIAWGDYSAQIHDYTERGLPQMLRTAEGMRLGAIVDPYTLRHRVTIPKLIITGTNDPYWPLDAANLYWDELPEPKYILYVPNSGHGLNDIMRVINAQVGFFMVCTGRASLPRPSWQFEVGSYLKLHIQPGANVKRVTQLTARAPTRDFREATWEEEPAIERDDRYLCRLLHPDEGYAAIFGEVVYDLGGQEFPVSTNVRIIGPEGME
ncbi:MAG: PhoPQ-activated protein PqaA family protein [Armatimonadota bacterium]|nr:PhoPQ-activated protein PqaA family protein [Armatimonadota bacterium]